MENIQTDIQPNKPQDEYRKIRWQITKTKPNEQVVCETMKFNTQPEQINLKYAYLDTARKF